MAGPENLDDPREVCAGRLRQKLHRELGEVILAALADERVVEVMVNGGSGPTRSSPVKCEGGKSSTC
jgi:hypothetical protein